MTAIKVIEFQGQVFLYVYADGLRYTIVRDMLPSKTDYDEIFTLLQSKVDVS